MCLGLTGCGASLGAMLTVRNCIKTLSEAESISFTLSSDGEAEALGEAFGITLRGSGVCYLSPFALTLEPELGLGKIGSVSAPIIIAREEGSLVTYTGIRPGEEALWIRKAGKTVTGAPDLSDPMKLMSLIGDYEEFSIGDDPEDSGLVRVVLPSAILMGDDEETESFLITIQIDKKTSLPVRITADLAATVQSRLEKDGSGIAELLQVTSLPTEILITGTNEADAFEAPKEDHVFLDLSAEKDAG